jgi:acyl dehydratase
VRDVVFKRPVRLGDTIRVEGKLAETKPVDESAGLVAVALTVTGARGQTVLKATVEVLWRRDAEVPAPAADESDALTCVPL